MKKPGLKWKTSSAASLKRPSSTSCKPEIGPSPSDQFAPMLERFTIRGMRLGKPGRRRRQPFETRANVRGGKVGRGKPEEDVRPLGGSGKGRGVVRQGPDGRSLLPATNAAAFRDGGRRSSRAFRQTLAARSAGHFSTTTGNKGDTVHNLLTDCDLCVKSTQWTCKDYPKSAHRDLPMPRTRRKQQWTEEACYHVMNRGHNRERIFGDDDDRRHFLGLFALTRSASACGCIMTA